MTNPLITEQDKDIALEQIIYDLLIRSIKWDINLMNNIPFKLRDSHQQYLEHILKKIRKDAWQHKKLLSKQGIKILPMEPVNENFVRFPYLVRGHDAEFCFFKYALKNHTENKLQSYYFSTENSDIT